MWLLLAVLACKLDPETRAREVTTGSSSHSTSKTLQLSDATTRGRSSEVSPFNECVHDRDRPREMDTQSKGRSTVGLQSGWIA